MSGISSLRFDDPVLNSLIASIQNSVGGNDTNIATISSSLSALTLQVGSLSPDNVVENAELTAQAVFDLVKTLDGPGSGLKADIANTISTVNPTISEVGSVLHDSWLNSISGELFVCIDNAPGSMKWIGSLGAIVEAWNPLNDQNLIHHYTMENVSGSLLIDEMGNSNAGISGAVITPGANGDALKFDGGNDYLSISTSESFSDGVTFAAYVRLIDFSDGALLSKRNGGSGNDFQLYYTNTGKPYVLIFGITGTTATQDIPLGDWCFYAVSFGDGVLRIQIDDSLEEYPMSGTVNNSASVMRLAEDFYSHYSNFELDDVYIFNRALSASEINILKGGV